MPGLLAECKKLFGTKELYDILAIAKVASKAEVKKAYYKLSLAVHPDRVDAADRVDATHKFQVLGQIYGVLSDDDRRSLYDETGSVDDESFAKQDCDWVDYWRLLFPRVELKEINDFESKYRNSAEELGDLKTAYLAAEGDMGVVLDTVMCCTLADEPRFRQTLDGLVAAGELPEFVAYTEESASKLKARRKKAAQEQREAEQELEALKRRRAEAAPSLQALIQSRQASRAQQADNFLSQLEQKYSGKGGGGRGDSGKQTPARSRSRGNKEEGGAMEAGSSRKKKK